MKVNLFGGIIFLSKGPSQISVGLHVHLLCYLALSLLPRFIVLSLDRLPCPPGPVNLPFLVYRPLWWFGYQFVVHLSIFQCPTHGFSSVLSFVTLFVGPFLFLD